MEPIQLDPEDPATHGPVHVRLGEEIERPAGDYLYFRWDSDGDEPLMLFDRDGSAILIDRGHVKQVDEPVTPAEAWVVHLSLFRRAGTWINTRGPTAPGSG